MLLFQPLHAAKLLVYLQITIPVSGGELQIPRAHLLPSRLQLMFGIYVGMPQNSHKYLALRYTDDWTRIKYTALHHTFTGGQVMGCG